MYNIRIGQNHYSVNFETGEVYNWGGGKLRSKEKIEKILKIASKCKEERDKISNKQEL